MRVRYVVYRLLLATVVPALLIELLLQAGACWVALRDAGESKPPAVACTVLCVGDSYTYGLGASEPSKSYPARLEALLGAAPLAGGSHVVNGGWPGRNSRNVLENLATQIAENHPRYVSVLVGINDLWSCPERFHLSEAPPVVASEAPTSRFRLELRLPRLWKLLFRNPTSLGELARASELGAGSPAGSSAAAAAAAPMALAPTAPLSTQQQVERSLIAKWRSGDVLLELMAGGAARWDGKWWVWEVGDVELVLTSRDANAVVLRAKFEVKGSVLEVLPEGSQAPVQFGRVHEPARDGDDLFNAGREAITAQDFARALDTLTRGVAAAPDHVFMRGARVEAAMRLGRPEVVDEELANLRRMRAEHPDLSVTEALVGALNWANQIEEEKVLLREDLERYPRSGMLWCTHANVAEIGGDSVTAEQSMTRALELQPDADRLTLGWRFRCRAGSRARRSAFREALGDILEAFTVDGLEDKLRQALRPYPTQFTPELLEEAGRDRSLSPEQLARAQHVLAQAVDRSGGGACQVLADHLRDLARYCHQNGAEVVVVTYPYTMVELQPVQRAVATEMGLRFVDLQPRFDELLRSHPKSDYFVPDKHCNDAGYAIVAEMVAAALHAPPPMPPPPAMSSTTTPDPPQQPAPAEPAANK